MRCLRRFLVGLDASAWQLLLATTEELNRELHAVKAGGRMAQLVRRNIALRKYQGSSRDQAAAAIALYWQDKMKARAGRLRFEALLAAQEAMLLGAVAAMERDREMALLDGISKEMAAARRRTLSQGSPMAGVVRMRSDRFSFRT